MSYVPADRPAPPLLSKQDEQHLDLLSILFYVYAAFVGLITVVMAGMAMIGLVVISTAAQHGSSAPPAMFGAVFLVVFGAVALLFAAKTVVLILAGRALGRRSGYVMAMVGACFSLINVPLGTALGVFALITLSKPGVRERLG
jgi:hypothetical protein